MRFSATLRKVAQKPAQTQVIRRLQVDIRKWNFVHFSLCTTNAAPFTFLPTLDSTHFFISFRFGHFFGTRCCYIFRFYFYYQKYLRLLFGFKIFVSRCFTYWTIFKVVCFYFNCGTLFTLKVFVKLDSLHPTMSTIAPVRQFPVNSILFSGAAYAIGTHCI